MLSFFGRSKPAQEPASVLAEWNAYSHGEPSALDVEVGAPSLTGRIGDSLNDAAKRVTAGVATVRVPSAAGASYAAMWFAAGALLLLFAVFVALPVIILAPSKFATCFTLGCLCMLASVCSLFGWRSQLATALAKERAPLTVAYAASALATLWAALSLHSYFFSLVFSGVQAVSLFAWCASYVPGGASGVTMLASGAARAATSMLMSLIRR